MIRAATVCTLLAAVGAAQSSDQQPSNSLTIFCSLDHTVIAPGGSVTARALADPAQTGGLEFHWTATEGAFIADGRESSQQASGSTVVWSAKDAASGPHKIVMSARNGAGQTGTWSLTVVVSHTERGDENVSIRDLGRAFLPTSASETPNYGLYSYLILPRECESSHAGTVRQRCEIIVRNLLLLIGDEKGLKDEDVAPAADLDITYLLVTHQIPRDIASSLENVDQQVNWILSNYDASRCDKLLIRVLGSAKQTGPFIISSRAPLLQTGGSASASKPTIQDFSDVPLNIVPLWVQQFRSDVLQHPLSQPGTIDTLFRNLRKYLAIAGLGLGPAQAAVKSISPG